MSAENLKAPKSVASVPSLKYARREAMFVMGLWAVTLVYTVVYCYVFGYSQHDVSLVNLSHLDRKVENLRLIFGVPDWVFWGVGLPWFVCVILTVWFSFWFMKDEDLGKDFEAELAERIREEGQHE